MNKTLKTTTSNEVQFCRECASWWKREHLCSGRIVQPVDIDKRLAAIEKVVARATQ